MTDEHLATGEDALDRLLAQNVTTVRKRRRREWAGFVIALVALLLAIPAFIAGIGLVAYQVQPVGLYGKCPAALVPMPCTDVPLGTLEQVPGLSLPTGTLVVSSSSSVDDRILDSGRTTKATVRLPAGSASPLPARILRDGAGSSTQYSTVDGSIERQFVQHTDREGRLILDLYMRIKTAYPTIDDLPSAGGSVSGQ